MQKTRSLASHASVDIHLPVPFADRPPIEAHPCPTRFRHNEAGHIFNNQCDSSVVGDAAPAFISSFRKLLCLSKECQWHRYNGFALLRCHRKTKNPPGAVRLEEIRHILSSHQDPGLSSGIVFCLSMVEGCCFSLYNPFSRTLFTKNTGVRSFPEV